jgi:UDP-3-O-[3-hydroxymyristoyl] glucosamine N-acyltransferase
VVKPLPFDFLDVAPMVVYLGAVMMKQCREITAGELARILGGTLEGDETAIVRGAGTLQEAQADQVSFLANSRYERHMNKTQAAAVIVTANYKGPGRNLIRCQDAYFAFRQAMVLFYGFRSHPLAGVDRAAHVDPTANLDAGVSVGPFAYIGPGAKIGLNTVIYPGVFVGPDVRIGCDCVLYPNAVIYDRCILGDRVVIHSCSVIGEDGFGYATHEGRHEKIPPAGWVEIGDDTEIGANCAIDRATLGATAIGAGSKFSNLVAIGHGTRVGKGCLFVAQSGVAGSTIIGDYCAFAGQSGASGHLRIGDHVRIGAQAGVHSDVTSDQEILGSPALPLARARRVYMTANQLPEMRNELKRLTQQIAELEARLEQLEGKGS